MAAVKKSLFLSDRLQKAIGPQGGFHDLGSPVPADASLTRRLNVLGDRYQSIIDDAAIEKLLTRQQLMRIAEIVNNPWTGPTSKIADMGHILAVANRIGIDEIETPAGKAAKDYVLIKAVERMSFPQKVAAIEWIERNIEVVKVSPKVVPQTKPSAAGASGYVLSPRRLLRSAAMGLLPHRDAALDAIQELNRSGFTAERASFAHQCMLLIVDESLPSVEFIEKAMQEIGN